MILFICSRETDYLQDLTYSGLAQVLGKSRMADFPAHWQFHRRRPRLLWPRSVYPRNLGYLPGSRPAELDSFESVRRSLDENKFRLVVLSSAKPDALLAFQSLLDSIRVPWIFIDGGDWTEVGGDFKRIGGARLMEEFKTMCRRKPPALIFKRELPLGSNSENVFPLPFSVCASLVAPLNPDSEKQFQAAFWAVESSVTRRKAFEILKGRYDCERNGSVGGQTFKKYKRRESEYFRSLNQTRISLSFRGEGFDTLRFWEIPMCGSLLLSEAPAIQMPHPFSHGKNAAFCKNDLSDLTALIDYYLAHEDEARQIARLGQEHILRYHTHERRAEYVLEVLNSKLGMRFV